MLTNEHVRAAGGIVHGDGNIFFTNIDKLNEATAPLLASIAELERLRAEDLSHFLDMAAAIETLGIKLADANEIIEQRNKMLSAQRLSCR